MKKLIIILLFIPLYSCQNVEVRKTYYDSSQQYELQLKNGIIMLYKS